MSLASWCVRLTDRAVVSVVGRDACALLQNLATNDLVIKKGLATTAGLQLKTQTVVGYPDVIKPVYTGFLNKDGRLLFDAHVLPVPVPGDHSGGQEETAMEMSYLLDVHTSCVEPLIAHLTAFRMRKRVVVQHEADSQLWAAGGSDVTDMMGGYRYKSYGYDGLKMFVDPRNTELGVRVLAPPHMVPPKFPPSLFPESLEQYTHKRCALGIAEGGDISLKSFIPLECNFVELNGVSFTKGCYLGQELIARAHHTGAVRKRILPIWKPTGDTTHIGVGDGITNASGDSVGKVVAMHGEVGLALLRLEGVFTTTTTDANTASADQTQNNLARPQCALTVNGVSITTAVPPFLKEKLTGRD